MLPDGFTLGAMREDEVDVLAGWAADEGWNPGLADAGIAWEVDREGWIALRRGDELAGGGTILSYAGAFGFMGLFIVREDLRGHGLGGALWHHRLELLRRRLAPGASIGMDGVFAMVPFYERGGFRLAYRDLRFEGIAAGAPDPAVVPLAELSFAELAAYDRQLVPAPRDRFLARWVGQQGAHAIVLRDGEAISAYGVARPCRRGYKLGPVFADSPDAAERVVGDLLARIEGEVVQLDVPEPNEAGLELAARHALRESFGCVRMYHGPDPGLPVDRIFGVTSFEFG